MANSDTSGPVYVSYTTFKNGIRSLNRDGHIPEKFDGSLVKTMSGSAKALFIVALSKFGLVAANGNVSAELMMMATPDERVWVEQMTKILRTRYADQMDILTRGTPKQLADSFGEDVGGSVREKAMRFLLSAAEECKIPVSPHIKGSAASASTGPVKRKKKASRSLAGSGGNGGADVGEVQKITPGTRNFPLPIPGKAAGYIVVPDDLDESDMPMLEAMLGAIKVYAQRNTAAAKEDDDD